MKKIFLWIILFCFFFVWWSVFANDEENPFQNPWVNPNEWIESTTDSDNPFQNPWVNPDAWSEESSDETEDGDISTTTSGCNYTEWASLWEFLNDCKPETVVWWTDMKIDGGFKAKINQWIANIALVLWIGAVGALVYASLLLQLANGEDEKIKKSKDIIKWTMIGFIMLISASGIIYIVINVMFWLWWE